MKKIELDGIIPVNCYLIAHEGECYVVDPGYEKQKLRRFVEKENLHVKGILLTHGHIDHMGALDAFDVPVYLHRDEVEILKNNDNNGFNHFMHKIPYDIEALDLVEMENEQKLQLGSEWIHVLHAPGHTKGSICYLFRDELYSGDVLFRGSVGKWDFPSGDQRVLRETVISLIESMSEDTIVYPSHGEATTIGDEKAMNGYYRFWKTKGLF